MEIDEYNNYYQTHTLPSGAHSIPLPLIGVPSLNPQQITGFTYTSASDHGTLNGSGSGPTSVAFNFHDYPAQYLVLQWDGPQGGAQFFYVGEEQGSVTFNSPWGTAQGLSGYLETSVAVPEPTTVIAGVLLLLPFGASMFRILRRNH
jgi:hypothetical protein